MSTVTSRRSAPLAVFAAACASLAALPASASAAETFEFTGRGWGHGVGLSQYGARGAALAGWDEDRILAHYYRGTRVERRSQRPIRVLLRATSGSYAIRGPVVARAGADRVRSGNGVVRARAEGDEIVLAARDGREILRADGPVVLRSGKGVRTAIGPVRGTVRLDSRRRGVLEVVNALGLEQYLRGVVPKEVPASWGEDTPAALRAQAIAARTYALATRRTGRSFDVFKDVRSQVYGGIRSEDPRTDAAIAATAGKIVTYRGRPIVANFFSTSGGRTAEASDIWPGSDQPYLASVEDPFDHISPFHVWPETTRLDGAELAAALGLANPVAEVRILERGVSPRVTRVEVVTENGGRSEHSGAEIRTAAGLRSTWFTVTRSAGTPEG